MGGGVGGKTPRVDDFDLSMVTFTMLFGRIFSLRRCHSTPAITAASKSARPADPPTIAATGKPAPALGGAGGRDGTGGGSAEYGGDDSGLEGE